MNGNANSRIWVRRIREFFVPGGKKEGFYGEAYTSNKNAVKWFSLIMFLIQVPNILFYDLPAAMHAGKNTAQFFLENAALDIALCAASLLYAVAGFAFFRSKQPSRYAFRHYFSLSYCLVILAYAVLITGFMTQMFGQITIYIMILLGISATITMRWYEYLAVYLLPYAALLAVLFNTQHDRDLLGFNVINSAIFLVSAIFISRLLYNSKYGEYRKRLIIEDQKTIIENERNEVKKKHEIIENELKMARVIQYNLIPAAPRKTGIAAYYQPMHMIGGDFYDFIHFREKDQIGIFICDVSGHGVPAALITTMIKTLLLNVRQVKKDPAALLSYINDGLNGKIGNNFATAFYAIYTFSNRRMVYANAGHNHPYILGERGVGRIEARFNGYPLGIFSNAEMAGLENRYENQHIRLQTGSKILFYTDGLVEVTNGKKEMINYEKSCFPELAAGIQDRRPEEIIRRIVEEMESFRGNNEPEDDVSLICLET